MTGPETGTIRADVPARLDRQPPGRRQPTVPAGPGTVRIGHVLGPTIVGRLGGQLAERGGGSVALPPPERRDN